jgi:hypothetical protein
MIQRWSAIVLALLCVHCGSDDSPDPLSDRDRDGTRDGLDCAPDDAWQWRRITGLYLDADRDGHPADDTPRSLCAGATVPAGYLDAPSAIDCHDGDPAIWQSATLHVDEDGDGHGTGDGAERCIGADVPAGLALAPGDCAPADPAAWQALSYTSYDADGDGRGPYAPGQVCAGAALPPQYRTDTLDSDCDDTDATRWIVLSGHADDDRDGVGAGALLALCTAGALEPGYAGTGTDCAPEDPTAWAALTYSHRDADGDGVTLPSSGTLCTAATLPPGYTDQPAGDDCDDADPARWQELAGYLDEDRDGTGTGEAQAFCTSGALPDGIAPITGDCAATDPARWQILAYAHRDADADGHTTPESGSLCVAEALPPGFTAAPAGNDCDDADPAVFIGLSVFLDGDGDGVGAGAATPACTDGAVPAGFSATGTDCASEDPDAWQVLAYAHIDADADGATVPSAGTACSGESLPDPFRAAASGNDCDDADAALTRFAVLYPDQDGDGVGAPPRAIQCIGEAIPAGQSPHGYDPDDGDPAVTEDPDEDDLVLQILG